MNAAIAQHLNIAESLITEVQEWAHVLWVRFVGGVRFVSKKVVKVMTPAEKFIEIAERVVKELGRGTVQPHKSSPCASFYPLGAVQFYKGKPSIGNCLDDEARFMIRDLWAKEGFESNQPEKQKETREWFFGAADEESF